MTTAQPREFRVRANVDNLTRFQIPATKQNHCCLQRGCLCFYNCEWPDRDSICMASGFGVFPSTRCLYISLHDVWMGMYSSYCRWTESLKRHLLIAQKNIIPAGNAHQMRLMKSQAPLYNTLVLTSTDITPSCCTTCMRFSTAVCIVLYCAVDAPNDRLCEERMKLWWENGKQDQLRYFFEKEQFMSFAEKLNERQIKALEKFTSLKVKVVPVCICRLVVTFKICL